MLPRLSNFECHLLHCAPLLVRYSSGATRNYIYETGHARSKPPFYWKIYNAEERETSCASDINVCFLMVDKPSPAELQQNSSSDNDVDLNKDLEKMIEDTELISVQLTWMAYDMAALRTSPELDASMRRLEEAFRSCRVAVRGDREPGIDLCPKSDATTLTKM